MTAYGLRCATGFSAWGKDYAPGDPVDATNWPDPGALAVRIANGFVEIGPAVAPAAAPEAKAAKKTP